VQQMLHNSSLSPLSTMAVVLSSAGLSGHRSGYYHNQSQISHLPLLRARDADERVESEGGCGGCTVAQEFVGARHHQPRQRQGGQQISSRDDALAQIREFQRDGLDQGG